MAYLLLFLIFTIRPSFAQERLVHDCKGVDIDLTEEHALSVDDCLKQFNASSIKDISPSAFACVGKCVMEKTGLIDGNGKPHKENIFSLITDALPKEVHDDLGIKVGSCLDEETESANHSDSACPRTFDGWSCWNSTSAGDTAYASCPTFITGFEPTRIAHKRCMEDGTWFRHPENNSTWSNYTNCVDIEALQVYQNVNLVYQVGYSVSILALILSLFIFIRFKSLSCTRVTLHKHLFASFIINNCLWLVWYRTVVTSQPALNQVYCALIHILTQYFMLANYFWMFCEGFYLHTLLVYAFTHKEKQLIGCFCVFAWIGPALPIGLYTTLRGIDSHETKDCWMHNSKWDSLMSVPVCICLIVSLAFLINIVRVLVTKLNAINNRNNRLRTTDDRLLRRESIDNTHSLRKASRATLILIPLLGLHYFIIPFRPRPNQFAAVVYEYVAAFTSSLQGLAVSLIFCFCNGEVIQVLRRHVTIPSCFNKRTPNYSTTQDCSKTRTSPNETINLVVMMKPQSTTPPQDFV